MVLIKKPYSYSTHEQIILDTNPVRNHNDWSKGVFNPIKKGIRTHLFAEQNGICPYCSLKFPKYDQMNKTIDHIVPKSKHIQFMFTPLNLAISCKNCNVEKDNKETLVNPDITKYPTRGEAFKIIHPYFDIYSDHIELLEEIMLSAITSKGEQTIQICNINVLEIAEKKQKEIDIEKEEQTKKSMLLLNQYEDVGLENIFGFLDQF